MQTTSVAESARVSAGVGAQAAEPLRTDRSGLLDGLLSNAGTESWPEAKPPDVESAIVEMAHQALGASSCALVLSNGHGHRVFYGNRSDGGSRELAQTRTDRLNGPAAWVVQSRAPLILNSPADWDLLSVERSARFEGPGTRVLCVPVTAAGRLLGALEVTRRRAEPPFSEHDLETANVIGTMAGISVENSRLRQSVEDSCRSTIQALASAIDAKDPYTRGHSQRVAQHALASGRSLGLSDEDMRTLETAALLHDIGKIGIDDAILRKPRKLTPAEHAAVRDHPVIGAAIIHDVSSLRDVADLVLHHHEAYDGSGYPHGLSGESIPLGARLIAVADAFDSMTTNRPYRSALSINDAMSELLRCRGTQFCPRALDAFGVAFSAISSEQPSRHRSARTREALAAALSC